MRGAWEGCIHTCTHKDTHRDTQTRARARTHTHTHMHMRTHAHACMHTLQSPPSFLAKMPAWSFFACTTQKSQNTMRVSHKPLKKESTHNTTTHASPRNVTQARLRRLSNLRIACVLALDPLRNLRPDVKIVACICLHLHVRARASVHVHEFVCVCLCAYVRAC